MTTLPVPINSTNLRAVVPGNTLSISFIQSNNRTGSVDDISTLMPNVSETLMPDMHGTLTPDGNSTDMPSDNITDMPSDNITTQMAMFIITRGPIFDTVQGKMYEVTVWPLIFTCIYMLLGAVGNAVVLYIYGFKWEKREKTRIFILCLGILDFSNCVINMPVEVALLQWPLEFDHHILCKATKGITYIINNTGSLVFVAIAIDRYLLVYRPLKRRVLSSAYAVRMCVVCFLIASAVSWPSFIFYGSMTLKIPLPGGTAAVVGKTCLLDDKYLPQQKLFFIFTTTLFALLLVVFLTLITLYIAIGRKIYLVTGDRGMDCSDETVTSLFGRSIISAITGSTRGANSAVSQDGKSRSSRLSIPVTNGNKNRNPRFIDNPVSSDQSGSSPSFDSSSRTSVSTKNGNRGGNKFRFNQMSRRMSSVNSGATRHNTLIMRVVTIAFMVSFTPFLVILMLRNTMPDLYLTLNTSERIAYQMFLRSYLLNSVVNPYIYGFMNNRFRTRVKWMLQRLFCSKCSRK